MWLTDTTRKMAWNEIAKLFAETFIFSISNKRVKKVCV
jgi:hypothetical protein